MSLGEINRLTFNKGKHETSQDFSELLVSDWLSQFSSTKIKCRLKYGLLFVYAIITEYYRNKS